MTFVMTLFMWFIVYSAIGWLYESILCSVQEKQFVNRGFLTGPICPVYGCGAIAVILLLGDIRGNYIALFLSGSLLTCTIEYITAYILERLFNTRWWDYSEMRFNLNGRVCLLGALVFGAFALALIEWIHPLLAMLTEQLSSRAIVLSGITCLMVLSLDLYFTVYNMFKLNGKLAEIQSFINEFIKKPKEQADHVFASLYESVESSQLAERIRELIHRKSFHEKRIIKAFPRLKSINYNDALQKIKEIIHNKNK